MFTAAGFAKTWEYASLFKEGLICTIALSVLTVVFGFILALLLAIMRLSDFRPFRAFGLTKDGRLREPGVLTAISKFNPLDFLATAYVEILRSTPVMVQIFVIYYIVLGDVNLPGFKIFGTIRFDRFFPGVVALSMNSGAYLCEIIRAGIQSIDGGQTEAARSLGLSSVQTMRHIILPQAIRNILPPIANEFVVIIKESAVCWTIGVQEIMYAVNSTKGATYRIAEPLIIATLMYFCLCFPTSKIIAYFERRMSRGSKR